MRRDTGHLQRPSPLNKACKTGTYPVWKKHGPRITSLLFALLVVSGAILSSCTAKSNTEQPSSSVPLPPTEPLTPGYARSHDLKLGYGFEYPRDWQVSAPQFDFPYEGIEVLTSEGSPTQVTISVRSTDLLSLSEVRTFGYVDADMILSEEFIEVNDREAYEVVFRRLPDGKVKLVIFLVDNREYRIECHTLEDLYPASNKVFNHIIGSFVID